MKKVILLLAIFLFSINFIFSIDYIRSDEKIDVIIME